MEILNDTILETTQTWALLIAVLGLIGCLLLLGPLVLAVIRDEEAGIVAGAILFCCVLLGIAAVTPKVPTGQHKYTVSITDDTKYKELIDKGYKFSTPLYDNLTLYEITGDPLQ